MQSVYWRMRLRDEPAFRDNVTTFGFMEVEVPELRTPDVQHLFSSAHGLLGQRLHSSSPLLRMIPSSHQPFNAGVGRANANDLDSTHALGKQGEGYIVGTYRDYQLQGNDLLGIDFKFNKFRCGVATNPICIGCWMHT